MLLWKLLNTDQLQNKLETRSFIWIDPRVMNTEGLGYGVQPHFQQYFSYIVEVSLLMEETTVPRKNH